MSETPPAVTSSSDVQNWRLAAHLSALVVFLSIPPVVGPLIVWAMKKDDPEIGPHARAALNFHVSFMIYELVALVLVFVLIGIPLLIVLVIVEIVGTVLASIKAANGELYSYPFSLDLVK